MILSCISIKVANKKYLNCKSLDAIPFHPDLPSVTSSPVLGDAGVIVNHFGVLDKKLS